MGRWSDVECRDRIRTANLIASCDRFRDAVRSGDIGVAQAHELGRAFANARCGSQLVDVAKVMVDNATKLSHHEFRITVRRWEMLTGNAREAVLLQSSRCVVAGCAAPIRRCQADHLTEWNRHGLTDGHNGAPVCGRHNRLKNSGYRVHRDPDGFWHTYRPDGTEIC
jgi:hypothetical protein